MFEWDTQMEKGDKWIKMIIEEKSKMPFLYYFFLYAICRSAVCDCGISYLIDKQNFIRVAI